MPVAPGDRVKTDRRDAMRIAKCLAYNTYSPVHVPTERDDAIKEYIRMRDDVAEELKKIKQKTMAFCTRHGKRFTGTKANWTKAHLDWLEKLDLDNAILTETLREYLTMYYILTEKVEMYDMRIEELASMDANKEKVKRLVCLKGIATHTALSLCVEVSDFQRFPDSNHFAAYLGLAPGSVSIMGLMNDRGNAVQLLIDEDVLKDEYLGCHPCVNTSSLKIKTSDIVQKFLPATGHAYTVVHLPG